MKSLPSIVSALCLPLFFASLVEAHLGQEHPEGDHDYFPDFEIGDFQVDLTTSACLHAARDMEEIPDGTGRFLSARSFNRLYMISPEQQVSVFHQLMPADTSGTEGFGALAIHPDFANSDRPGYGKIYGIVVEKEPTETADFFSSTFRQSVSHSVLTEITLDDASSDTFSGTIREVMRFDQTIRFHNVNDIDFGLDGQLYVAVGEDQVAGNAQSLSSPYGKILRIDPLGTNSANGKYGIPPDNPFVDDPNAAPEVYAIGLRNPWRMDFDSLTGDLYVGDVGFESIEEIDLIEKGKNYGWPFKEGSFRAGREVTPDVPDPVTGLTMAQRNGYVDPLFEYDHTDGNAIVGGTVYRGSEIPELYGKYIFGDWSTRALFYGDPTTGEMGFLVDTAEVDALLDAWGPTARFISIEPDADGELHLVGPNCIVRLTADQPDLCDIDGDGDCDLADLNELQYVGLGSVDSKYDLNQSGGPINAADTVSWLATNGYALGDADLDGDVDASDLNAVGSNWLAENITSWANGDFNGSGHVNAADLNLLAFGWQPDAAAAMKVAVPEPAGGSLLGLGLLTMIMLRRKRYLRQ